MPSEGLRPDKCVVATGPSRIVIAFRNLGAYLQQGTFTDRPDPKSLTDGCNPFTISIRSISAENRQNRDTYGVSGAVHEEVIDPLTSTKRVVPDSLARFWNPDFWGRPSAILLLRLTQAPATINLNATPLVLTPLSHLIRGARLVRVSQYDLTQREINAMPVRYPFLPED